MRMRRRGSRYCRLSLGEAPLSDVVFDRPQRKPRTESVASDPRPRSHDARLGGLVRPARAADELRTGARSRVALTPGLVIKTAT